MSTKDSKNKSFSTLSSLLPSGSIQTFDTAQLGLFADTPIKFKKGYISQEFQNFGLRLCNELQDSEHKPLYLKMAKTIDRAILEQALSFVSDANTADSKAKLFMWKVKQLRAKKAEKQSQTAKKDK